MAVCHDIIKAMPFWKKGNKKAPHERSAEWYSILGIKNSKQHSKRTLFAILKTYFLPDLPCGFNRFGRPFVSNLIRSPVRILPFSKIPLRSTANLPNSTENSFLPVFYRKFMRRSVYGAFWKLRYFALYGLTNTISYDIARFLSDETWFGVT